jgi:hypothetical protein
MTEREKLQSELIEKLKTLLRYELDCQIGNKVYFPAKIKNLNDDISVLEQSISQLQEGEVSYENYKEALKIINCYYRQVSGRDECVAFHIKYIQPIEEFIKQHQTSIKP